MGSQLPSRVTIFLLLATTALVIGYVVSGRLVYDSLIGLDPSHFPAGEWIQGLFGPGVTKAVGGLVVAGIVLVAASIAAVAIFLRVSRERAAGAPPDAARRRFLSGTAVGTGTFLAGLAGAAGNALFGLGRDGDGWAGIQSGISSDVGVVKTHPEPSDAWRGARVRAYGRLGRTGWRVSDTVLGAGRLRGDDAWRLVKTAWERGVNYVDTAPDYSTEGSELAVGRALREIPRDQIFLATKFCTPIGHLPAGTPVARYKEVVHESLRRLGTDYVDLVHPFL